MKKFLFLAVAALMVCFTSCSKDSLKGTSWTYSETTSEEIQGTPVNVTIDVTLNFETEDKGNLDIASSMNGMQLMNESEEFTYTFDGEEGTMTNISDDPGEVLTIKFVKTDKDHITVTEEDMEIVFTRK